MNVSCNVSNCFTCRPPSHLSSSTINHVQLPSVAEQMGNDPISKLAKAIERLADVLDKSA